MTTVPSRETASHELLYRRCPSGTLLSPLDRREVSASHSNANASSMHPNIRWMAFRGKHYASWSDLFITAFTSETNFNLSNRVSWAWLTTIKQADDWSVRSLDIASPAWDDFDIFPSRRDTRQGDLIALVWGFPIFLLPLSVSAAANYAAH